MIYKMNDRVHVTMRPSGETCHGTIVDGVEQPAGVYLVKLDKEYTHFDDDEHVYCSRAELDPPKLGYE